MHLPSLLTHAPFFLLMSRPKTPEDETNRPKLNVTRIVESIIIVALTTGALKVTSIDALATKVSDLQTMERQREVGDLQRAAALESQIDRIHRDISRIRKDVYTRRAK